MTTPGGPTVDVDRIARAIDPRKLGDRGLAQLLETLDVLAGADSALNLRDVRTQTLAGLLARASRRQLDEIAASERARLLVLDEVFRRMAERLRSRTAGGVVRWRIHRPGTDGDYLRFQTVVERGTCVTGTVLDRSPRVTLTLCLPDLLRLVTGVVGGPRLVVSRRLRMRGDLRFAARLPRMFELPRG